MPGVGAMVELTADELQFAGDTMIVWCDGRNVAQFKNWSAWIEQLAGDKPAGAKPTLATVTTLRPPTPGTMPLGSDAGPAPPSGPPEAAA